MGHVTSSSRQTVIPWGNWGAPLGKRNCRVNSPFLVPPGPISVPKGLVGDVLLQQHLKRPFHGSRLYHVCVQQGAGIVPDSILTYTGASDNRCRFRVSVLPLLPPSESVWVLISRGCPGSCGRSPQRSLQTLQLLSGGEC